MGKNIIVSVVAVLLVALGLGIIGGGAFLKMKAQAGLDSIQAISEAQDVRLSYNADGQLIDRGTPAGAQAIMDLLVKDWKFPVTQSEFDPSDPLVDTASELAFQMATINSHVMHGSQTIILDKRVEWDADKDGMAEDAPVFVPQDKPLAWSASEDGYGDAVFEAGSYSVGVEERFWTGFNRMHPLDGPARSAAWETTNGLLALINVGMNSVFDGMLGVGLGWLVMLIGAGFVLGGTGLCVLNRRRS